MGSARHLRLSTSEISDVTASMPSLGYFALQHRVAPPRKAYSLTSSAFLESGTPCPFLLFAPVFRGDHKKPGQAAARPVQKCSDSVCHVITLSCCHVFFP